MAEARWVYDLTIFLYAASVLFYFNDFLSSNRRLNRVAFGLLASVWLLQTVFFVSQMVAKAYFPVLTLFETLFFYSWVLVTLSLVINSLFRIDFLVFFTNVIGFAVLTLSMFLTESPTAAHLEMVNSELIFTHVTLAIISYGTFSLSMIFSTMYLFVHRLLKRKRWTPMLRRVPSLERLENLSYRMNMAAVPLLLLALILGVIRAHVLGVANFWLDAKVWLSLAVLAVYSVWLYKRLRGQWQGRRLAVWNLVAFVILVANFLFTDASGFHRWL